MEDTERYGYQFRSIPGIKPNHKASMMTWTLCSILSSINEQWKAVDNKHNPFRYDGWEGWMLTFVQQRIFSYDIIRADKKTPFRKLSNLTDIVNTVNRFHLYHPMLTMIIWDLSQPTNFQMIS